MRLIPGGVSMDRQQQQNNQEYSGYNSYGAYDANGAGQAQPHESKMQRTLERDMLLEEYEIDKDYILQAIKDALKERHYDEAQELVYKYRIAAKTDEKFAVLARLTAQGLETQSKVEKIDVIMDATPESDYQTRIALCNRALKIDAGNEKYKEELERCQRAIGINPNSAGNVSVSQPVSDKLYHPGALALMILTNIFNFLLMIGCFVSDAPGGGILTLILMLAHAWLYSNHKTSPVHSQHTAIKFAINFLIWFCAIIFIGITLP